MINLKLSMRFTEQVVGKVCSQQPLARQNWVGLCSLCGTTDPSDYIGNRTFITSVHHSICKLLFETLRVGNIYVLFLYFLKIQ